MLPGVWTASSAQGFGKNKIQYSDFEWRVLESTHFDLYFYPEEDTLARTGLRIAEEAYQGIAARFGFEVSDRIPLIIYSSHNQFEETNVSPYFLPEGVGGFTEFLKGRVALPFNGSYADFEHVIWHELVHVFQIARVSYAYRLHYRNSFVSPPLWFTEGMAEAWSQEWDATGELYLSDLVFNDLLPPIDGLWRYSGTFVIYKIGEDLINWLEANYGVDIIPLLYDELWRANSFEQALARVTETPISELSTRWHLDLKRRYYPRIQHDEPIPLEARPLAVKGGANFQAATVPRDGVLPSDSYFFFSPRNGYTNIYEGKTSGEEADVKRVVGGQRQAEFESFHGFESRMSLSKEGLLAFVSKYQGRDGLFVYDLTKNHLAAKWRFEELVGLRSPTFSPDGRSVVLAGLAADGRQDLYLFDLRTETLRALTNDRFVDDDPSWSPDGRTVAFVSDRTTWGAEGAQNVFLLDLVTGDVRPATYGPWKDGSPTWSPDGKRLAFHSDREGVPQIFVADSTLAAYPVTSILGGATDPAWLPGGKNLLFTGMSEQSFSIYRTPARARGDTLGAPDVSLPPMLASTDSTALGSPEAPPLWPSWDWKAGTDTVVAKQVKYKPHYTLDFAQGGVALEPAQGGVGQGLQARLSDQLGDRLIYFQLANTANSFGQVLNRFNLGVTYYNMTRRVNWGVSLFHFAGDFEDEIGFPYFERRVGGAGILSVPFSLYSRIETSMGLVYSNRGPDSFRPARAAPLLTNYISYVHDTTLWLATGPIDGTAARFTLGMNANLERVEVENINAAVDLRKYFRLGLRSAYAVRLLGYSSQGAYPNRFILGGSWSFRGYPRRAFVGTRAVLLNQEIRFPILSGAALGLPLGVLGLPPVQGAIFADVGQAWSDSALPRDVAGSFGLSFRTSLGGFLVLRLDVARLTDFYRVYPHTEVDFFVGFNY